MKKVVIDNRMFNVVSMDQYSDGLDIYNARATAIEVGDVVLPVRSPNIDSAPGVYYEPGRMVCNVVKPMPSDAANYSASNVIDLSHPKDIGEVISKNQIIRDLQSDLMVSGGDNVFCLTVNADDSQEMKALKTAINAKRIDKKDYEERFSQFQNDMRILKGSSTITLKKLISTCKGFDIACDIVLRDKDEDVPNPMNTVITIDLTEGRPMINEPT